MAPSYRGLRPLAQENVTGKPSVPLRREFPSKASDMVVALPWEVLREGKAQPPEPWSKW